MKRVIIILMIIITSFNVISANTFNSNENCAFKIALIKTITMVNPHDTFEEYGGFYQGDLKPLGIKNPEVIVRSINDKKYSRENDRYFDEPMKSNESWDHYILKRLNPSYIKKKGLPQLELIIQDEFKT